MWISSGGTLELLTSFFKVTSPLHFDLSSFHSPCLCLWRSFVMAPLNCAHRMWTGCSFGYVCPVQEIHYHLLGRGGFWHSDRPPFSLWSVCCAGSEWVQFTIKSSHQAYAVGTGRHHNHQRRESLNLFSTWILPSPLPPQNTPSGTEQCSVQLYSMYSMLVPSLV